MRAIALWALPWALLCAGSVAVAADPPTEADRVKAEVRQCIEASYKQDADTMLKFAHPKMVKLAGGEDEMRKDLEKVFEQMRTYKMTLAEFATPDDVIFVSSDLNEFAVIPMQMVVETEAGGKKRRVKIRSFQIGARKTGETDWKYVDGSLITNENVNKVFVDFPTETKLPKVEQTLE